MECPFCEHPKAHKHSKTSKGRQRYRCPNCQQTFTETLDTLYYRRQLTDTEFLSCRNAHIIRLINTPDRITRQELHTHRAPYSWDEI